MTSRERLLAAAHGQPTDRKPVLLLDGGAQSDVLIVPPSRGVEIAGEQAVLVDILNPFGRARRDGVDLNEALAENPEIGNAKLDFYVAETQLDIDRAKDAGIDGVFYRVVGAEPALCTPMQYGGYYLERDRALLEAADAKLNVVYIDAGMEAYMDFVSDLPAAFFAWDIDRSDFSVVQVRAMREGALAAEDPTADVLLAQTLSQIDRWISKEESTTHA